MKRVDPAEHCLTKEGKIDLRYSLAEGPPRGETLRKRGKVNTGLTASYEAMARERNKAPRNLAKKVRSLSNT